MKIYKKPYRYRNVSSARKIREKRKPGGETGFGNESQNHAGVRKIVYSIGIQLLKREKRVDKIIYVTKKY